MTKPPDTDRAVDYDVATLLEALVSVARSECWGREEGDNDCHCPACVAECAMAEMRDWRFKAALDERVTDGLHPAEARIVEAWRRYMGSDPDEHLRQILRDELSPTRRDWYVATSVVQWLATNIGSTVVEAAGYQYTKLDEDRACRDKRLPPTLGATTCESCDAEANTDRTYCGFCGRKIKR